MSRAAIGAKVWRLYQRIDAQLVAKGHPPTSPFWLATVERFLLSGRWQLVARVGRRGGKSSTLCRLAVALALGGEWPIPPGDIGHVIFVSTRKDEASSRLLTVAAILRDLNVPHSRVGDAIDLEGLPLRFLVLPCTVAGASGPTAICVICDEVAKYRDTEGNNNATEVLAALRPTLATMERHGAVMVLSSSPVGKNDAHARAFDRGDTDEQIVAFAPSWKANPTLTEEATHRLEPDPVVHAREYGAIPQGSALGAFDEVQVRRAVELRGEATQQGEPIGVIDFSAGRGDSAAWAVMRYALVSRGGGPHLWRHGIDGRVATSDATPGPWVVLVDKDGAPVANPDYRKGDRPILIVEQIDALDGKFGEHVPADLVVAKMARTFRHYGCRYVAGDQFSQSLLESEFRRHSLKFRSLAWSNPAKVEAVAAVRRWFREDRIAIPDDEELVRQLVNFEEKITPSGAITYAGRGRTHDDRVACLLTFAMHEIEHGVDLSPVRARSYRRIEGGSAMQRGPGDDD